RLRGCFRRRLLRANEPIAKLDGAPPNGDGGNEKEDRRCDERHTIVMRLNPVDCFGHADFVKVYNIRISSFRHSPFSNGSSKSTSRSMSKSKNKRERVKR